MPLEAHESGTGGRVLDVVICASWKRWCEFGGLGHVIGTWEALDVQSRMMVWRAFIFPHVEVLGDNN